MYKLTNNIVCISINKMCNPFTFEYLTNCMTFRLMTSQSYPVMPIASQM